MLVAAGDTGKDYEHCLELQKKVNDLGSEVICNMIWYLYGVMVYKSELRGTYQIIFLFDICVCWTTEHVDTFSAIYFI